MTVATVHTVTGIDFLEALPVAEPFAAPAREAYEAMRDICSWFCDPLARWARAAYGEEIFAVAAQGYAEHCRHVDEARRAYDRTERYAPDDRSQVLDGLYANDAAMAPYMWATALSYAFWPSMTPHLVLLRDAFLNRLSSAPRILELACGHGAVGLVSLDQRPDATLLGYDISPPAIRIAHRLAGASPHAGRARFAVRDVLELDLAEGCHDGVIATMLAEHLPDPRPLFDSVARYLAPEGLAFVSTALESPQRDHVYEFRHESEAVALAEAAGLRVAHMVCEAEPRTPGARFTPRSLAMVLTHG